MTNGEKILNPCISLLCPGASIPNLLPSQLSYYGPQQSKKPATALMLGPSIASHALAQCMGQ